jgi:hypothetical protein
MALAQDVISILGGSAPSGTMSAELGWNSSNENVSFIVDEALAEYGVSAEADVSDAYKMRAILKVKTWEQVLAVLTNAVDFSADGASYRLSQMREAAEARLVQAYNKASPYLKSEIFNTDNIDLGLDVYLRDSF